MLIVSNLEITAEIRNLKFISLSKTKSANIREGLLPKATIKRKGNISAHVNPFRNIGKKIHF